MAKHWNEQLMRYDFGEHYTGKKLLRKNKIHFFINKVFFKTQKKKSESGEIKP